MGGVRLWEGTVGAQTAPREMWHFTGPEDGLELPRCVRGEGPHRLESPGVKVGS